MLRGPLQGATAMALQPGAVPGPRPRLAAALRVSKRAVRVAVYEIMPGAGLGTRLVSAPALCLSQADLPEPLLVKVRIWDTLRSPPPVSTACHDAG